MADAAASRISVLRDAQLVPLIPSPRPGPRAPQPGPSAPQPWNGILLERHSVPAVEIPEHEHRDLCLHLQLTGTPAMEWWSDGRHAVERTAPGSLVLVPAGTRDRLRWQSGSERLILSVASSVLAQAAAELDTAAPEFRQRWTLDDSGLRQLLTEMGREAAAGWPLGALYAGLLGQRLTTRLLGAHAESPAPLPSARGGLPMPRLRRAMDFLTANLGRDLHLDEVARELELSPFHFARRFRQSTGQTPYQYLLDQRIAQAKRLLRERDWPVQEIAAMTGFSSAVNFGRAFRQRTGQTPGAWRRAR